MKNKMGLLARGALLLTALIWGTSFVILKNMLDNIGTFWIMALRFSIAAIIFSAVGINNLHNLNRETLLGGVVAGTFLAVAYLIQTFGLSFTTPGKNAFLTATYCVLVPFMVWAFYRHKPGAHNIVAAFLCIAGIGFVSLNEGFGNVNIGDVLTLVCGLFYALQIIAVDSVIDKANSAALTAIQFITAALLCWIGALTVEAPPASISAGEWIQIIYMGAACTGLGFFLQAWGMKYTPASTAAVIMTLEAVFGALCSVIFYDDRLTVQLIIGFVLIFVSVVMSETGFEPFEKVLYKLKGEK